MRVSCVICGELFLHNQDVSATPCGHTFHTLCIIQWIERSKSCPQCRNKATEKTLKKLFFDASNADTEEEPDPAYLLQQLDNIKFQLKLKEQELRKNEEECRKAKEQAAALKEELKVREEQLRDKSLTIKAMQTQLQHVDKATGEAREARKEAERLRRELKLLEGVKEVVSGSVSEVEMLLQGQAATPMGLESLASFCSVLKKELNKSMEEKWKMRAKMTSAKNQQKEAMAEAKKAREDVEQLECIVKTLKDDVESLERNNTNLKKKLGSLEHAIASPSDDVRNSALHRLLFESPAPEMLRRLHSADSSCGITPEVVRKRPVTDQEENKEEEEEKEEERSKKGRKEEVKDELIDLVTPPRKGKDKSRALFVFSDRGNLPKKNHMYAKMKPSQSWNSMKLEGENVGYDGLGGHHMADIFPKPIHLQMPRSRKVVRKGKGCEGIKTTQNLTNYFKNTFDD